MIPRASKLAREAHLRIIQQLGHDDLAHLPRQVISGVHGPERQIDGPDRQSKGVARVRSVLQSAHGQSLEGFYEEGLEDRGHGLHGDDGGDGATGDDPAVGDGYVRASGDAVHGGGSKDERGCGEMFGGWIRGWGGVCGYILFQNGNC